PMDPVRFISNPSSGKMGYAIARAAEKRGGSVTLISGPTVLPDPINITTIRVTTAKEMADAVFERVEDAHIIIKTAAVSDYSPAEQAEHKIKKEAEGEAPVLRMKKNQDILKAIGERKGDRILVGFAAETEALDKHAQKKLVGKNLDIIAGNLVNRPDSGFGVDSNIVTLYYKDGTREPLKPMEKDALAHVLLERVVGIL
ncbi:MAG: phosphopantothenoylcysteine decarboxylase, partial [Desulfobacterales bacterium]|nr:phosphopantothenoylcysteine decarboxylase [Desulfobacterales bacterium]